MRTMILAAALAGSMMASSAGAVTWASTDGSTTTFNNSASGAQFTFESNTTGNTGSPAGFTRAGGQVMKDSTSGVGANPFGAPTGNSYLYVTANSTSTISAITNAITGYKTISFYMGSIDAGNTVQLLGAGGALLATYTGATFTAPTAANGQQTLPQTNRLLTFTADAGQVLTGIRFSSSVNSLEADNVRFTTAVPEPATWAMMMLGFAMVGATARYRRRSSVARFA